LLSLIFSSTILLILILSSASFSRVSRSSLLKRYIMKYMHPKYQAQNARPYPKFFNLILLVWGFSSGSSLKLYSNCSLVGFGATTFSAFLVPFRKMNEWNLPLTLEVHLRLSFILKKLFVESFDKIFDFLEHQTVNKILVKFTQMFFYNICSYSNCSISAARLY